MCYIKLKPCFTFSVFWLLSFQDYEGTIELLDLMDPPWGTSFPKDWIWKYQNGKYLDPYEGVFMIFLHSLKSKFTTGTKIEMKLLFAIHLENHVKWFTSIEYSFVIWEISIIKYILICFLMEFIFALIFDNSFYFILNVFWY